MIPATSGLWFHGTAQSATEVKGIAREPGYRTKLAVYSRALAFESPCLGTGLGKVAWALVGHPETSGCSA